MLDNATVLAAAAHLKQAELAVDGLDSRFQVRAARALIAVQFVALVRWVELRAFASATHAVWPLAATIEAEFDLFASAFNASGLTKFKYRVEQGRWSCPGCPEGTITFNLTSFRYEILKEGYVCEKDLKKCIPSHHTNTTLAKCEEACGKTSSAS